MTARLSLIVAASDADVIGRDGTLPWKLSADLRRFKALTLGKPVIMGRRTFESIGRALPERLNIVISRDADFAAPGCSTTRNLSAAIAAAGNCVEIMIIGGADIYALALPLATRLYLTRVHGEVSGDTTLRGLDLTQWRELSREAMRADERNSHASTFFILERRAPASA